MQNSSCFLEKVKRCTSTKLTVETMISLSTLKKVTVELEVLGRKNKYFADFHKKSFLSGIL